jgi:hypothetical protein
MPNARALATVAVAFALVGCSDKTATQVAAMNKSNIQRVSNLYAAHQNMKGGKGPKDEASFKAFVAEFDPAKLKMMGVEPGKTDELFKSERDGQPFVIRYGIGGGRGSVSAVVFEQTGKDGKREVGFTSADPQEVDDAKYKELLAGKGNISPPAVPGGSPRPGGRPSGGAPPGAPRGPNGK